MFECTEELFVVMVTHDGSPATQMVAQPNHRWNQTHFEYDGKLWKF